MNNVRLVKKLCSVLDTHPNRLVRRQPQLEPVIKKVIDSDYNFLNENKNPEFSAKDNELLLEFVRNSRSELNAAMMIKDLSQAIGNYLWICNRVVSPNLFVNRTKNLVYQRGWAAVSQLTDLQEILSSRLGIE